MILVLIFNDFNGSLLTKLNLIRSSYSFKRFLFHFRCPFGLGFDEANLICNWPWLVPGCGGTVAAGAGVGAGAIGGAPRGGKFLRPDANRGINRQPAGRQEKAFGRGNSGDRPSFAENNAGFQSGIDPLNSFKSANPARQSTITARPATATLRPITPAFVTTPDPNAGFAFGDIAVDGCDNCESPGLRVVGNGVRNGKGLEVANAGSGFPTSTFSPSTTVGEGGYSYPVPANPLELPVRQPGISVSNPGEIGLLPDGGLSTTYAPSPAPSTTYAPSPIPSSTYAPAPIPSSTYAPSPIPSSTYAPSPIPSSTYAPSSTAGYEYPVPVNPLQYPTEVVQPVVLSTTARPPFQSTTPAFAFPSTTRAPIISSTYGAPEDAGYAYPSPAYPLEYPDYSEEVAAVPAIPIVQSTPQPIYQTSPQPTYPSPTRAPIILSTTPEVAYQPIEEQEPVYFSTPAAPLPTAAAPAYQPENAGGYVYNVPANPLVLPERDPRPQNPDFKPPPLEFGGFKPPFEAEPEDNPNSYQQPAYVSDVRPSEILYGFQPSPDLPNYTTQRPRQPFADPSFKEPARPIGGNFASGVGAGATFVPAFNTPRPTPARVPVAPIAPIQGQREVASVIPSGFTSATLSNGPNSIDQGRFAAASGSAGNPAFSFGNSGFGASAAGNAPRAPKAGFGNSSPDVPSAGLENDLSAGNSFGSGVQRPSGGAFVASTTRRPAAATTFGSGNRANGAGAFGNGNNNGNGFGGGQANGGNKGNGNGGFNGGNGNPAFGGNNGNGGNRNQGFGGSNGNGGGNGNPGFGGNNGNGGFNGGNGNQGFGGNNGNGGFNGGNGNPGFGGSNGNGGFNGGNGLGNQAGRGGREFSRFEGTVPNQGVNAVTAVTRPVQKQPAVLDKFKGTDWNKFGPGGFRTFNDTIGPEVCERPGLFRHPTDCDKFYECYYDKWIDKFTVHVFPCPIVLGYDTGITACNWPFDGPQCQAARH